VHPILFAIGEFFIGTYGVMMALGLVLATLVALWRAKRVGVDGDDLLDIAFLGVIAGIVGARVVYILVDLLAGPRQFLRDPWSLIFAREGFVFWGGLLTATLACLFIVRRRRLNPWLIGDIAMTSVPMGHAIGRVGCFLAGCCFGSVVDPSHPLAALAVRFPSITRMGEAVYPGLAFEQQMRQGLLAVDATRSLPVWPVQLFEAAGCLAVFAILLATWPRRRFHGQIFLLYAILYSLLRFALEYVRGDVDRGAVGPFSTSQTISLVCFVMAVAAWPFLKRAQHVRREPALAKPNRQQRRRDARAKKTP
jgi:phosphatidylglycerol:prolipoprotein diacylglycerol transferase